MGEDIDGFRRLLASYKMTISIALADANLSKSAETVESVKQYGELIEAARAGLEERLDSMDDKLGRLIQNASKSASDKLEIDQIKEERLSTEKCLEICGSLSEHINEILISAKRTAGQKEDLHAAPSPATITVEGLQECRGSLLKTAQKLAAHERSLLNRLVDRTQSGLASVEEREDMARLRDQWEAARQAMDICLKACEHLKDSASTIDNHATGDAVQVMVSTNGKTIHGTNRGFGWRVRQVGGHMSDETLRDITRNFSSIQFPAPEDENFPAADTTGEGQSSTQPEESFRAHYGGGFTLK